MSVGIETNFEKGKCNLCQTKYDKLKITSFEGDGYYQAWSKEKYQQCPGCDYNPEMIKDIESLINSNVKIKKEYFQSGGNKLSQKTTINSKELSDLISKILEKYWLQKKVK